MASLENLTQVNTSLDKPSSNNGNRQDRLTVRLNTALGVDTSLSLEAKLRRALRAAQFEETPSHVWRKVLPSMPEGVGTMRANELFCWARSHMVDAELRKGASLVDAYRIAAHRLLSSADE
ncbi:MAG: hypothetical protein HC853_00555 [Anaerolineae bacterium]|nr:hypothetical protein [Anaerolineae bacterium]